MTTHQFAQILIEPGTNGNQVLRELQNVMGGSIASHKGWGAQLERDGRGKIIAVYPFFGDKVPQNERAAALTAIADNKGVASVGFAATQAVDDAFETAPLGSIPQWLEPSAKDVAITDETAKSGARSLKIGGNTPFNAVYSGSLSKLVGLGSATSAYVQEFAIKFPTDFAESASPTLQRIHFRVGTANGPAGSPAIHMQWDVTTAGVAPATSDAGLFGTTPIPALPFDGAWHTLRAELIAPTLMRFTMDGGTAYDYMLPAGHVFHNDLWGRLIPDAVATSPYFYIDDFVIDYELVAAA
jgi:hypothetical protein